MFKGPAARMPFKLTDGLAIVGLGRLSVYEPRGTYQVIFEHLEPKGRGALQLAFEQLKARLAEEGLFDKAHKQPLPFLPRKVHIITSPTGAVVHDTIQIIQRRFPNMPIAVIPARVQGEEAAADIVGAIERLNRLPDAEVALLARGGGSLEDLQPFNSEAVARAIFASSVPIISAVGHETDFTIADFAADMRAPTPSAAAELVVPEKHRLQRQCAEAQIRLVKQIWKEIRYYRDETARLALRLRHPGRRVQELQMRLDDLEGRLLRVVHRQIEKKRMTLNNLQSRLARIPVQARLLNYQQKLDAMNFRLLKSLKELFVINQSKHRELTCRLATLSPLNILQRGYSITRVLPSGRVVKNADMVTINQQVQVRLAYGDLLCRVEGKHPHGEENL
jgi:exodeoxyribonuclease VII large subunit